MLILEHDVEGEGEEVTTELVVTDWTFRPLRRGNHEDVGAPWDKGMVSTGHGWMRDGQRDLLSLTDPSVSVSRDDSVSPEFYYTSRSRTVNPKSVRLSSRFFRLSRLISKSVVRDPTVGVKVLNVG